MERIQEYIKIGVKYFLIGREFIGEHFTPTLPFFYVLAVLLSGAFLWLTVYCIAKSGYINSKIIEKGMDYWGIGDVGKRRQLKVWNQVIKRMQTGDLSNWKLAVMEADHVMDEIIKSSGFRAGTADDRFGQLTPESVSNQQEVLEAHKFRNRCAQEPDFVFTKDEALKVLRVYKKAFQEFGLLD